MVLRPAGEARRYEMKKYIILFQIIIALFYVYLPAYACIDDIDESIRIEMKEDQAICITVYSKNKPPDTKCFSKNHAEYNEIIEREKLEHLKPGQVIDITTDGC